MGEGKGREGKEGGILYFPSPGCWDVGSCEITIFAWWGCSVCLVQLFCVGHAHPMGGGGGDQERNTTFFQNKVKYDHNWMVFMGLPMTKSWFSYFHITLKVTSKIHKNVCVYVCVCVRFPTCL